MCSSYLTNASSCFQACVFLELDTDDRDSLCIRGTGPYSATCCRWSHLSGDIGLAVIWCWGISDCHWTPLHCFPLCFLPHPETRHVHSLQASSSSVLLYRPLPDTEMHSRPGATKGFFPKYLTYSLSTTYCMIHNLPRAFEMPHLPSDTWGSADPRLIVPPHPTMEPRKLENTSYPVSSPVLFLAMSIEAFDRSVGRGQWTSNLNLDRTNPKSNSWIGVSWPLGTTQTTVCPSVSLKTSAEVAAKTRCPLCTSLSFLPGLGTHSALGDWKSRIFFLCS